MSLIILTKDKFYAKAKGLYGDNPRDWIFKCEWCDNQQSMNSIMNEIEQKGFIKSQRYGIITKKNVQELQPKPDQECISPDCNYASYGLFGGSLEVDGHRYLNLARQLFTEVKKEK